MNKGNVVTLLRHSHTVLHTINYWLHFRPPTPQEVVEPSIQYLSALTSDRAISIKVRRPCLTKLTQAMKLFAASPSHSCLYTGLICM